MTENKLANNPGRVNNFDLARLLLALLVVGQHMGDLTGSPEIKDWFRHWSGLFAVQGFFAISGYLIAQSWERCAGILDYFGKRFRRLYPAYIVSVILFGFLAALVSTFSLGELGRNPDTWRFLIANLTFMNFAQDWLPGVFTKHPHASVNGALWTIKVEVMFYAFVPAMLWAVRKLNKHVVLWGIFALSGGYRWYFTEIHASEGMVRQLPGQLAYFVGGTWLYLMRGWLAQHGRVPLVVAVVVFVTSHYAFEIILRPVSVAILVLGFCLSIPHLGNWARFGDFSYGIYIVHFPVIQLLTHAGVYEQSPLTGVVVTFAIVLGLAFVSWHVVEKRFLLRSSHYLVASVRS